jgi:hypothetical protein
LWSYNFPASFFCTPGKRSLRTNTSHNLSETSLPLLLRLAVLRPHLSPNLSTMARALSHRALTGHHRHKPKRWAMANERWLHLSLRESCLMGTLQLVMATKSTFCVALNQLCALILAAKTVVTIHANLDILDAAFDSVSVTFIAFLGLLQALHLTNMMIFNIPFHEEAALQQFSRPKNLCLADLNNVQTLKMTHFNQDQLCQLYAHFCLAALVGVWEQRLPYSVVTSTTGFTRRRCSSSP